MHRLKELKSAEFDHRILPFDVPCQDRNYLVGGLGRCGRIVNDCCTANFLVIVKVKKKFENRPIFDEMCIACGVNFFGPPCRMMCLSDNERISMIRSAVLIHSTCM